MTMTLFVAFIAAVAGFALCWFAKDEITILFTGTESFIKTLEAKAAALKAVL
jgi:hypothetical protein